MKSIIFAMFSLVLAGELAAPQTQPVATVVESCSAEPPALPTYTELDPKPARYSGPACLNGETCDPPSPDYFEQPGYKLTDQGAEITYEDQGQLYTHECPAGSDNAYWFEEDQWVLHDTPTCWKREPVKTSSCELPHE